MENEENRLFCIYFTAKKLNQSQLKIKYFSFNELSSSILYILNFMFIFLFVEMCVTRNISLFNEKSQQYTIITE